MKIPELTRYILEKKRVGLLKFSGGFALYSQHLHAGWYWCKDSDVKTGYSHMQMWVGPCGLVSVSLVKPYLSMKCYFQNGPSDSFSAVLTVFLAVELWYKQKWAVCYSACTFVDTTATWVWLSDCAFANHEQFKLTQLLIRPVLKAA